MKEIRTGLKHKVSQAKKYSQLTHTFRHHTRTEDLAGKGGPDRTLVVAVAVVVDVGE